METYQSPLVLPSMWAHKESKTRRERVSLGERRLMLRKLARLRISGVRSDHIILFIGCLFLDLPLEVDADALTNLACVLSPAARLFMGKASKGGVYAVKVGAVTGLYSTWEECRRNVSGYPGAVYKKLPSEDEARRWMGQALGPSRSVISGSATSGAVSRASPYFSAAPAKGGPSNSRQTHSKAKDGRFYAVKAGYKPGIYTEWDKCLAQTSGFTRPAFKRFSTRLEAEEWLNGDDAVTSVPLEELVDSSTRGSDTHDSGGGYKVYCDGAAHGNGTNSSRAGWGVWFEDPALRHLNEACRLPGETQTNNRAELMAIIRAIQLCPSKNAPLTIYTDSQYSISALTEWVSGWRRRGWRLASGGPVQNRDLIRRLELEINTRPTKPTLVHVKGHSGIRGNELADRLANTGAALPVTTEHANLEPPPSDSEDL